MDCVDQDNVCLECGQECCRVTTGYADGGIWSRTKACLSMFCEFVLETKGRGGEVETRYLFHVKGSVCESEVPEGTMLVRGDLL